MNKIGLGHELNISQTLEMMLSPRMLQMLKLLNMNYVDLVEEMQKETEENVMLELEKPSQGWAGIPATVDPTAVQRFLDRAREGARR